MVTSKTTLDKINKIIEKHYSRLAVSVLGRGVFSPRELQELQKLGVDTSNESSFLELVYYHNFINNPINSTSPNSIEDMEGQQSSSGIKPEGEAHTFSVETLNEQTKQSIDKLKEDAKSRLSNIIRSNNLAFKNDALQNLERSDIADALVKESSLGKVKQQLRDSAGDANRDWMRVALTEVSNAVGMGSVDRIVTDNRSNDLKEVIVYRVIVGDSKTCKHCRKFYGDVGKPPKLYRLSTLLGNGSNYGLQQSSWKPVIGATHPNTRTSQVIELKPGFKVLPGGSVTYIGLAKWQEYILQNLEQ